MVQLNHRLIHVEYFGQYLMMNTAISPLRSWPASDIFVTNTNIRLEFLKCFRRGGRGRSAVRPTIRNNDLIASTKELFLGQLYAPTPCTYYKNIMVLIFDVFLEHLFASLALAFGYWIVSVYFPSFYQ